MMTASTSPAPRTAHYHIDSGILMGRYALIVGALGIVPILMALSGEPMDGVALPYYGGLVIVCIAVALWFGRQPRITLSPEGVEFRSVGFRIFSPWDNIERIDTRHMYGEGPVEGFALHEDGLEMGSFIKYGRFLSLRSFLAMKDYDRFIPVSMIVTKYWRSAPFGQDVRRYAPRLLEQD